MRVLISTGEVSGDIVGALVATAIVEQRPGTEVLGIGGARMAVAGVKVTRNSSHLGTVGITETVAALRHYPAAFATVRAIVRDSRPDVALLIGNDLFHTVLARCLRRHGIATVAYFPPQIWVWRAFIGPVARSFDVILTSFPEEQSVYERESRGARVNFVGHYLADVLDSRTPEAVASARPRLSAEGDAPLIGLMPGSRGHEVNLLLPAILGAAARLREENPTLRFVLPVADPAHRPRIEEAIARAGMRDRLTVVDGSTRDAMIGADLLIVASGTATLEAALLGVPMVIVYKLSAVTAALVRGCIGVGLLDSDMVGLPNRILGERAVPELLQRHATSREIASEAQRLLHSEAQRATMLSSLAEIRRRVSGNNVVRQVADSVLAIAGSGRRRAGL